MMRPINFDAMRIKIEFLFRTAVTFSNRMSTSDANLTQDEVMALLVEFVTAGVQVIHFHRRDGQFQLSEVEEMKSMVIAEYIGEKFTEISHKIYNACQGLPITLTVGKEQLYIAEGMDEIIKYLVGFYAEEEHDND